MAQTLKTEVRERIVAEATRAFATAGYRGARLQDIAQAAGVATGNLYRYYRDKDALFDAIVPRTTAARLLRLLRARVRELGAAPDWTRMTAPASAPAAALLAFLIEQRTAAYIVLAGAEGSSLAHVRPLIVRELTRLATAYLAQHDADAAVPPAVLRQIFGSTVDMIVAILRDSADADAIAQAFAAFWRYQLAGLQALMRPS